MYYYVFCSKSLALDLYMLSYTPDLLKPNSAFKFYFGNMLPTANSFMYGQSLRVMSFELRPETFQGYSSSFMQGKERPEGKQISQQKTTPLTKQRSVHYYCQLLSHSLVISCMQYFDCSIKQI